MWLLWLIVAIAFGLAEMMYSGFFLVWFAIGALAALLTSLLSANLYIQILVFIVVSTLLLLTLTKKITQKFAHIDTQTTNIDALVGTIGIVTEPINTTPGQNGQVKLDGEIWTATSTSPDFIDRGTSVIVQDIRGVRLIVTVYIQN